MTVTVVFVDASTATEFDRAEVPPDQLPDGLAPGHRLHLGDDEWEITAVGGSVAAGEMTLTLRRPPAVTAMSPADILYSLPTIADPLAATDPSAPAAGRLELHEDEWRQIEYVDRALRPVVERELDRIRRIWADHRRGPGFDALHVREEPARPLDAYAARALLPPGGRDYPGFGFRDIPGLVVDGFAIEYPGAVVYGTRDLLALRERPDPRFAPALAGLLLVDWCRAEIVE